MKIDYILLYNINGTILYSQCFNGFCNSLGSDRGKFDDFLIKLVKMPKIFNKNNEQLKKYDIGDVNIIFHALPENDTILCFGLEEKHLQGKEKLLHEIGDYILNSLTNVVGKNPQINQSFTVSINDLMVDILAHINHTYEAGIKVCPLGENCPLVNINK